MPGWWRDTSEKKHKINGGFFKYFPKDCKYIYDRFINRKRLYCLKILHRQRYNTVISSEQYFVEDSVNERLKLKIILNSWVAQDGVQKKILV